MLTNLSIKNYALIEQLDVAFKDKFTTITGETGAGKSILLGALGLVLGNRADLSSLKDTAQKCIVEAQFDIKNYSLQAFFEASDLDYEPTTIIRREILPSGKSRAFVNDTPVTLSVLNALKQSLIDVHSQHQTLKLSDSDFQFQVIDALANNQEKVASYKRGFKQYNVLVKELEQLEDSQREANQQYDYNLHLFNELEQANLQVGEQEQLEEQLEKLNNVEEIKQNLSQAVAIAQAEEVGLQSQLHVIENGLQKIASYSKEYQDLLERISSVKIEFDDIVSEIENANDSVVYNPTEIEQLNDRLQLIYSLQKKHYVSSFEELQQIHEELAVKVEGVASSEEKIAIKQSEIDAIAKKLNALAQTISKARTQVFPKLKKQLEQSLADLGMQNARFLIETQPSSQFLANGKDVLSFLFSANKGGSFGELKKVASGGELSRIMLTIKSILSKYSKLPTIIFDEIDTGVSGEISNKMATIMQQMASNMQVITITHLPQVASKGNQHYKVFKTDDKNTTQTNIKVLNHDERILEIAEMIGGKQITDVATQHAKELLN